MRHRRAAAAAALAAGAGFAAPWAAQADPTPTDTGAESPTSPTASGTIDVPLLGTAVQPYDFSATDESFPDGIEALVAVHGVRRIEGGTVLYYSLTFPPENADPSTYVTDYVDSGDAAMLVDGTNRKAYEVLQTSDWKLAQTYDQVVDRTNTSSVLRAVFPPLPADATTVDAWIAGTTFADLPVDDGALAPASDYRDGLLLGSFWPSVPMDLVKQVTDYGPLTHDVTHRVTNVPPAVNKRVKGRQVSVDLSSDVLFDVDEASFSGDGADVIADAIKELKGVKGTVVIVGHTDDTGSAAHNLALSKRRAAAVEKALRDQLPGVTFKTSGAGETTPLGDNSTPEGRQRNRRVTITFQAGGAR